MVQLENIRSHVKSTVPFVRGFNCLVGGLGCGKSSVLYAIDFALFGDPLGRSYNYLLREGAEIGKTIVQFIHDGKSYRISRELNRRRKRITQNSDELRFFEGERLIASGKNEAVAEQLKAITGLDKELFREIVWVKQERLKELLDARPRERQKRLDEFFGLSDYERGWNNLAGYEREYEGERRAYENDPDVAGIEKLRSEYDKTVEDFSVIEIELKKVTKKLSEARKSLNKANMELEKLEEAKGFTEKLKQEEAQIQANLVNAKAASESLSQRIEENTATIQTLKQQLSNVKKQIDFQEVKLRETGISRDQPIGALRKHLSTFDDQIASLQSEQGAALRNIQTNEKRISSLSAENLCPLCLQPITEDYRNSLMQKLKEESSGSQKTTSQLQRDIEELQQIKSKANDAFSTLQILSPQLDEIETRVNDESKAFARLSKDSKEKQRLEKELFAQLETVQTEIMKFDLSRLAAARAEREKTFKEYHLLESELRIKKNRRNDVVIRLDEIKQRIDQAQKKIERMEKIRKIAEIIDVIRRAYRNVQPKLRSDFVKILRTSVQQVLDSLMDGERPLMNVLIDETYTPYVRSGSGVEREVSHLSGGERTLLAFAYRMGLGQLIMQSRTGHGLSILLLDEPTESLGREDGSIDRLAEAISRLKAIEQMLAVTHSEAFAEKASHVIRLEKEAGVSQVSVEEQRERY